MPSGLPRPSRYSGIETEFSAIAVGNGEAKVPSTSQRAAIIDDIRVKRAANIATVWLVNFSDATLAAIPRHPCFTARSAGDAPASCLAAVAAQRQLTQVRNQE